MKKKLTKVSIEDIHEYIKYWYDTDGLTDFNMAYDSGYTQYCAYLIKSAAAINPETSVNPEIESAILKLLKKYKPNRDIKECFGDAEVWIHNENNEHLFIKNKYVDYLIDTEELINSGYELRK